MDLYWSWVPGLPRKLYWPVRVISWDGLKVKVFCKADNAILQFCSEYYSKSISDETDINENADDPMIDAGEPKDDEGVSKTIKSENCCIFDRQVALLCHKFHDVLMNLEDVFLKLCQEDIEGTPPDLVQPNQYTRHRVNNWTDDDDVPLLVDHEKDILTQEIHHHHTGCLPFGLPSWSNIMAQFVKNLHLMRRNIGFLLFQFALPVFEAVLFCLCIGNDPYHLPMAIINNDVGIPLVGLNCGQMFLNSINNHSISQIDYTHRGYTEACHSVKQKKTWGIIMLDKNFSLDLSERFLSKNISDDVINGSSIKLQLDSTNEQIYLVLVQKITEAFERFSSEVLEKFSMNPKIASLPIEILQPVYGDSDATFTEFMAPGVIISITFFLATGMTTLAFVMDKKMGMFDRCLSSGMVSFEIMLAHMFTQMLVVVVQVALLLIFMLLVFHIACNGPLIWVIILVLLQGFCGMALGVLFASICDDEVSALQLALGSYFPLILISGIIWPVESMPQWLQYISYGSPMTFACEAMRCILARGLDITFYAVWRGYIMTAGWCVGLVIIGGIILRFKE